MYRSHNSKGQSAMEFMVMLGLLMLAFATFYAVFADKEIAARQQHETLQATMIADRAAFEVKMALTQGNGYHRNFSLPSAVRGHSYTITTQGSLVVLEWDDRQIVSSAVAETIAGSFVTGENSIENDKGVIRVN